MSSLFSIFNQTSNKFLGHPVCWIRALAGHMAKIIARNYFKFLKFTYLSSVVHSHIHLSLQNTKPYIKSAMPNVSFCYLTSSDFINL